MKTGILALVFAVACHGAASAGVRIKDITDIEGARSNHLIGFGLVVGLDGTGSKSLFTQQVAVDMLQRLFVSTKVIPEGRGEVGFKSGNISAVMLTAEIGPFQRKGSRIDVTVSALDDATSLRGGQLLFSQLKGADNVVYALAQGSVLVGGFSFSVQNGAGPPTASAQKNHPTVGRIPAGAILECEARGKILCEGQIRLVLRAADDGTARSIAKAINVIYPGTAVALDAGSVRVFVPDDQIPQLVSFVSDIGLLEVEPDLPARVVVNERTGTVVVGENVRIATVAVTHGNLAISTSNEPVAAQPLPFARGKTVVLPRAKVGVTEEGGIVRVLEKTMTVAELARALNSLGATPQDLIIILTELRRLNALHAELVTER